MRVSLALLRKKMPNGHIFRGKDRLVKIVDAKAKRDLRFDFEREERNMHLLLNPYLTVEQSAGHAKDLCKKEKWLESVKSKQQKFLDHVVLEQHLCHLRFGEKWE